MDLSQLITEGSPWHTLMHAEAKWSKDKEALDAKVLEEQQQLQKLEEQYKGEMQELRQKVGDLVSGSLVNVTQKSSEWAGGKQSASWRAGIPGDKQQNLTAVIGLAKPHFLNPDNIKILRTRLGDLQQDSCPVVLRETLLVGHSKSTLCQRVNELSFLNVSSLQKCV